MELLTREQLDSYKPDDLLEDYPLKPHELLRDRTDRVFDQLRKLADRKPGCPVWIVADNDSVLVKALDELAEDGRDALKDRTVICPQWWGGLAFTHDGRSTGMLDGDALYDEKHHALYDVADEWMDGTNNFRRRRVWDEDEPPGGMRLVRNIDTRPDTDDEAEDHKETPSRRYWKWYVRPRSADDDGSRTARAPQELRPHLESAQSFAQALVDRLRLASRKPMRLSWRLAGMTSASIAKSGNIRSATVTTRSECWQSQAAGCGPST